MNVHQRQVGAPSLGDVLVRVQTHQQEVPLHLCRLRPHPKRFSHTLASLPCNIELEPVCHTHFERLDMPGMKQVKATVHVHDACTGRGRRAV